MIMNNMNDKQIRHMVILQSLTDAQKVNIYNELVEELVMQDSYSSPACGQIIGKTIATIFKSKAEESMLRAMVVSKPL